MAKKSFGDRFEDAPDAEQLMMGMPPVSYTLNGDVTRVAEDLIAQHGSSLGHLLNFKLCFLRRESSRTDNAFHPETASGVFIRADRERALAPQFEAGIWVQGHAWDRFNVTQRRAWLHSLLLRLGMTPKGALKKIRPDVSEWAEVVRLYGPWADQLVLFSQGLDAHENPPPTPAAIARRQQDATPATAN